MTQEEIRDLAEEWISAWNAHDLDAIMSRYDEAVELTSPVAAQLLAIPGGKVSGKANVSAYFQPGLEAYPQLYFDLKDVLAGLNTLVLYYANQKGTRIVGGLHLFAATDEIVDWTASKLRGFHVANLLAAHCTGIEATFRLRQDLGLNRTTAVVASVGSSFSLADGIEAGPLAK